MTAQQALSRSTRKLAVAGLAALSLVASIARADEISVTQWGTSLYGLPYAVAMEDGMFKKAGIDITGILGSGGGGTTVRNILASDTPYGEVAVAAALAAQRQGLDLVIVNIGTRSVAESSVVTLKGSPLKDITQLDGKKVAITSPKGVSEMLLLMSLKAKGIDADKVTRVASGGYVNGLTLLDQKAVDAAVLIEPLSILRKDQYTTLYKSSDLLPPMTTSVGITTREFAKAHPDRLKAIIEGRQMGVKAIYDNPQHAADIIAKTFKLEPAIAKEAVDNMIAPHMWSEGDFNLVELERMADGLRLNGELKGDVDWAAIMDKSYLPSDLQH
jgi:NitT/TauT family transport system substrate-binding protein